MDTPGGNFSLKLDRLGKQLLKVARQSLVPVLRPVLGFQSGKTSAPVGRLIPPQGLLRKATLRCKFPPELDPLGGVKAICKERRYELKPA